MKMRAFWIVVVLLLIVFSIRSSATGVPASDLERLLWPPGAGPLRSEVDGFFLSADTVRGRPTVVAFMSAGCAIDCALRTMALDTLAADLPAPLQGRVVILAVGTDPADAPGRLRAAAEALLGTASHLRFVTPDRAGARAIAETLTYPASKLPEPPPTVLLFDRTGSVAMAYGAAPLDADRLRRDLVALDSLGQGPGEPPAADAPSAP